MELIFFTTSHNMLSFTSKQTKKPHIKVSQQCLYSIKVLSISHSFSSAKWAGREQLTQTDQREGSTACNIMLSNKNCFCDGGCFSKVAAAQTLAGHWSAGGIIEGLCISWDWFSSPLLIKIPLSWPMSFSCFWSPNSFPHPTDGEEWAKWVGA